MCEGTKVQYTTVLLCFREHVPTAPTHAGQWTISRPTERATVLIRSGQSYHPSDKRLTGPRSRPRSRPRRRPAHARHEACPRYRAISHNCWSCSPLLSSVALLCVCVRTEAALFAPIRFLYILPQCAHTRRPPPPDHVLAPTKTHFLIPLLFPALTHTPIQYLLLFSTSPLDPPLPLTHPSSNFSPTRPNLSELATPFRTALLSTPPTRPALSPVFPHLSCPHLAAR